MGKDKLLIIRLSALGDVAMTIPVIYTLAVNHPDWQITVLTRPFFMRIFVNRPQNIVLLPFREEYKGAKGLIRLLSTLNSEHPTMIADFHNVLRSWLIDFFFRLKGRKVVMLDKGRSERKSILSHSIPQARPFIKRYCDVVTQLGFDRADTLISSLPEKGENILPECNIHIESKYNIGIAPFARYANKTYPLEQMKSVVRLLAQTPDCHIFLFGSKADASLLKEWEGISDSVTSIAGTMDIEHELALMKRLDLMVSMDSANMHLASLVGTRVVSIWGSTTPQCGFMGWNQSEDDALCLHLPCQPCTIAGSKTCKLGDLRCLRDITPEMICERIKKALNIN